MIKKGNGDLHVRSKCKEYTYWDLVHVYVLFCSNYSPIVFVCYSVRLSVRLSVCLSVCLLPQPALRTLEAPEVATQG